MLYTDLIRLSGRSSALVSWKYRTQLKARELGIINRGLGRPGLVLPVVVAKSGESSILIGPFTAYARDLSDTQKIGGLTLVESEASLTVTVSNYLAIPGFYKLVLLYEYNSLESSVTYPLADSKIVVLSESGYNTLPDWSSNLSEAYKYGIAVLASFQISGGVLVEASVVSGQPMFSSVDSMNVLDDQSVVGLKQFEHSPIITESTIANGSKRLVSVDQLYRAFRVADSTWAFGVIGITWTGFIKVRKLIGAVLQ